MKLSDLLEGITPYPVPSKRDFSGTMSSMINTKSKTGAEYLGAGKYGSVFDAPKKTNTVVKIARPVGNDYKVDGYYNFICNVIAQDNPYFPKVDELTRRSPPRGSDPFFTVKMEKLHPISSLSDKEMEAVFSRITGRPVDVSEIHTKSNQLLSPSIRRQAASEGRLYQYTLAKYLEDLVENPEMDEEIEDTSLQQAVTILRKMVSQGYKNDIHDENIMCRRTPYGPQIVFTDPFEEAGT